MKKLLCSIVILVLILCIGASALSYGEYELKNVYKPESYPMDGEPAQVTLTKSAQPEKYEKTITSLDGEWKFGYGTAIKTPADNPTLKYTAAVPSSIYSALFEAGVIKDPYIGTNQLKAKTYSTKYYYFEKTFTYNGDGNSARLCFDGVADRCVVYLNGEKVSEHQGMFGGPYIDVSGKLKNGENTVWVMLKPALDYTQTVVFNCSYGWHYGQLRPLGIWNNVYVEDVPKVEIDSTFITTLSHENKTMDYLCTLNNYGAAAVSGKLTLTVSPENFTGDSYTVSYDVNAEAGKTDVRLRFDIPEGKLWYPNTVGEQNLYTITSVFTSGGASDGETSEFGIRTLEFLPFPSGENQGIYNRTVVINGQKVFMKGAGWCTIDEMMRFEYDDYDRILKRAYEQGVNFLRAWGGGMPETDEFYSLCNKYGICVYQEWPCCWDSSKTQPANVLYETVILNTKRIRNNPSLIVYGGGNEGTAPVTDKTLNNMGKLTLEYDGTRPFWRQDGAGGGGGFSHDHIHWGGQSPEHYASAYANLLGTNLHEYGLDSMMNLESVLKYATEAEISEFPVDKNGTIAHHTATFNGGLGWNPTPYGYDIDTLIHYASDFINVESVEDMITGSQLAQSMATYLAAANARTQFPYTTAVVYYKMNDVYPGASWSVVDWYGAPKIAHWMLQDAYEPLTALGRFDRYNTYDKADKSLTVPIYLLDDAMELKDGSSSKVTVTAYNGALRTIKTEEYTFKGKISQPELLGEFTLTPEQASGTPMFVVTTLEVDGKNISSYYVPMNFDTEPGCLFSLPHTALTATRTEGGYTVKNTGKVPAVGVSLVCPSVSDTVTVSDGYFWLGAGEEKFIAVSDTDGITGVTAFNAADITDVTVPEAPSAVKVTPTGYDTLDVSWNKSEDSSITGYGVYANGEFIAYISSAKTSATLKGLKELTKYEITVSAFDKGGNESQPSSSATANTPADNSAAVIKGTELKNATTLTVTFSRNITKESAENVKNYKIDKTDVTSAKLEDDGCTVTLTTDTEIDDGKAFLTVAGVKDTSASGNITYSYVLINSVLRGNYPFDDGEGEEAIDISNTFEHNAVIKNAQWCEGKYGKALMFNGNSTLSLGQTDLNADDMTVTMWLKGEKFEGYNILFAKNNKVSGHYELYTQNGTLKCFMVDTGDFDLKINLNKYKGEWHHFAFVFEGGKLTVYIDGEAASTTNVGVPKSIVSDFAVGSLVDESLSFYGAIDEVQLYSVPLTKEAVKLVMNGDKPEKKTITNNVFELTPGDAPFKIGAEGATYSGFDTSVINVTSDGNVSIVGEGETNIVISYGEEYDLCYVSVKTPSPDTTEAPETSGNDNSGTNAPATTDADKGNGGGAVYIIIGCIAAVAVIAAVIIVFVRKRK